MIKFLFLGLLLIYYWSFYTSTFVGSPRPTSGSPLDAEPYVTEFASDGEGHFKFIVNGSTVWEHTVPDYAFRKGKIIKKDVCENMPDGSFVAAKGRTLYDYVKLHPEVKTNLPFQQASPFILQRGDVFYFTCKEGCVQDLNVCPSGTVFVDSACKNVNVCSGKPDGTVFQYGNSVTQYIECVGEQEVIRYCPEDEIFYYSRCVTVNNLIHYCKYSNKRFLQLDDATRVDCENDRPIVTKCKSGTKFFDKDYCESTDCVGKPDGAKVPLPLINVEPFSFVPGYRVCRGEKLGETVQCPSTWDDMLSRGDNLTFLPKVFDNQECRVPSFCENVFPHDSDVIVPVHDFTKFVKNWKHSEQYDLRAGFKCEGNVRKRVALNPGMRISKRLRIESACDGTSEFLPTEYMNAYYDCKTQSIIGCPGNSFFNGSTCVPTPFESFKYKNLPIFNFDGLNYESWIKAWTYSQEQPVTCRDPESTYLNLYNICSHPDCEPYAFLSQIPQMSMFLPPNEKAKCKYYEAEKLLKKESVDVPYNFWEQRASDEPPTNCVPGQTLKTGNFIWDSTIYATCDVTQPFIFCPSPHTKGILLNNHYACEPMIREPKIYDVGENWTSFEDNQMWKIKPFLWDGTKQYIRFNKRGRPVEMPEEGLEVPTNKRLKLWVSKPMLLEPRYRVTHPPNIAFEYDEDGTKIHSGAPDQAFLMKLRSFTTKPVQIPQYNVVNFVDQLSV